MEFQAQPIQVGSWTLVLLPPEASEQLPSRGMCMIEGELNGAPFQAPLEPDGRGGHWFHLTDALVKASKISRDSPFTLRAQPSEEWPEPNLPPDLQEALQAHPEALEVFTGTTSKARWDWLRWVRSTNNAKTRAGRIEKAISKLNGGQRRPCCFDRNRCTEPEISSNGILKL